MVSEHDSDADVDRVVVPVVVQRGGVVRKERELVIDFQIAADAELGGVAIDVDTPAAEGGATSNAVLLLSQVYQRSGAARPALYLEKKVKRARVTLSLLNSRTTPGGRPPSEA